MSARPLRYIGSCQRFDSDIFKTIMSLLHEKALTEQEMADAMINRAKNAILELRINTVYLEGKRLDATTTKADSIRLKQLIDENRRECAEMDNHIKFLERFKKTGGLGKALADADKKEKKSA